LANKNILSSNLAEPSLLCLISQLYSGVNNLNYITLYKFFYLFGDQFADSREIDQVLRAGVTHQYVAWPGVLENAKLLVWCWRFPKDHDQ